MLKWLSVFSQSLLDAETNPLLQAPEGTKDKKPRGHFTALPQIGSSA